MKTKKNDTVTQNNLPTIRDNSPASMIRDAITGKANLEQLEKLLSLQEKFEEREARKEYHKAMAEFKANPPKITKDKKVSYQAGSSNVHYNHASLANVVDKISTELSKHGLSASWTTKQNGQVFVTCRITHIKGHSEETTLSAPSDTTGSKNAIQSIGSTITYLERYTLLALTGLATEDMDDDGKSANPIIVEYISDKERSQIVDCLTVLKRTEKSFCTLMKIDSLEKLPKTNFQKAMNIIKLEADRTGVKLC